MPYWKGITWKCHLVFKWATRNSHFTILVEVFTNNVSAENTYFTNHIKRAEHKIMGFKSVFGDVIVFKNILIDDFQDYPFLYRAKVFYASVIKVLKINCKDETTIHLFNFCFICSGTRKVFRGKEIWFVL